MTKNELEKMLNSQSRRVVELEDFIFKLGDNLFYLDDDNNYYHPDNTELDKLAKKTNKLMEV